TTKTNRATEGVRPRGYIDERELLTDRVVRFVDGAGTRLGVARTREVAEVAGRHQGVGTVGVHHAAAAVAVVGRALVVEVGIARPRFRVTGAAAVAGFAASAADDRCGRVFAVRIRRAASTVATVCRPVVALCA